MQISVCQRNHIDSLAYLVYSDNIMKKLLPLMLLVLTSLACQLGSAIPTNLPQILRLADSPTPTATSLPTATPLPTPTPTPQPAARIQSAEQDLFIGDWDAAMREFRLAQDASADPEIQAAALVGMGRTYFLMGETAAALDPLRQLLQDFPDSPHRAEAYFHLGQIYADLSRWTDAAEAYAGYLSLRPGLIDAYVQEQRGDALAAFGDQAGALAAYQAATSSPRLPTDFALEVKLARTYARLGDTATALVAFDDISARTTSEYVQAQVSYLKGFTYMAAGQPDEAYAAYLHAVENYPAVYDAYLSLVELVNAGYPVNELQRGIVDFYAGEYSVALTALDRYLIDPADPATALYFKGLCLRLLDNSSSAVAQWDAVIVGYPGSSLWDRAWENKAYTQWAYLGQYAEAQQTLLSFVANVPQHPRAAEFLFDAARVAERDGRLAEAAQLWERLVVEYPLSGYSFQALFLAGISEVRQGNTIAAQATFLRAQETASTSEERAAATLWIGKTYQALGDAATAQSMWSQAAQMDPTGYYSERARDLIANRQPFSPPQNFDLGIDLLAERQHAEAWMRSTFSLPPETNLSSPGELGSDPRYQRGLEFWNLGLYSAATAEFDALRLAVEADPALSYRLANLLLELGAYRPAILAARQVLNLAGMDDAATLDAPIYFNHIRFGTYYRELVIPLAEEYSFTPFLVWSTMRQESLFERGIRSSVGARGLLQIMPATGAEISSRLGWPPGFTTADLDRPVVSIQMGLFYLDAQRDALDGSLYAALAAYNGGPGNASIWLRLTESGDPDLFLEIVRFDETRRYIKGIYEIFSLYRRLYERTS